MVGWLTAVEDNDLFPYFGEKRKDEISAEGGCLLWGSRIIVLPLARASIVQLLHETHPGIIRMKVLARSYMSGDQALMLPWRLKFATGTAAREPEVTLSTPMGLPRSCLGQSSCGFCWSMHFLLLIDSFSKWLEIHAVSTTSTQAALGKLHLHSWPT